MDQQDSSSETTISKNKLFDGHPKSAHLQIEEHDQAKGPQKQHDEPYSGDEVDRALRSCGDWIIARLNKSELVDVVTMITSLGLVVLGVVGAGFYYQQLRATLEAADSARDAVKIADQTMRLDERAWVSVLDITAPNRRDLTIKIVFVNTGKTPADNFRIYGGADIGKVKNKEERLPGKGVIAPGGKYNSILIANGAYPKDTSVKIHGKVEYNSVFGTVHWTKFCYDLSSDLQGFPPCESGNEIDTNMP